MKTGLAIAMRREQIGLSQEELGRIVGVSKATISRWESGDISNMRRDRIQKIADALRISPIALLEEETDGFTEYTKNAPAEGESEDEPDEMEMIALKATRTDWRRILSQMSRENKVKLLEYAWLLLQSQDRADPKDQ